MRKNLTNWLAVVAWTGLIFSLVPTVRTITTLIGASLGDQSFLIATAVLLIIGATTALLSAKRMGARIDAGSSIWLVTIIVITIWWSRHLQRPEEALHIIEYSILGVLLFNALRARRNDASVFVVALFIGTIIGTCDELLQWVVKIRYFDYRDIWLNFGTLFLTQLALAKGLSMPEAEQRPGLKALRLPLILATVQLLLLVLCLSGTPQRIQRWTQYFPALNTLLDQDDVLAEYGYRYEVPDIGVFYSRFTLDELQHLDQTLSVETAAILTTYRAHKTYRTFLEEYPSGRAPFVHEARVHKNSRTVHLSRAHKNRNDRDLYREHMTIAYREQLILDTFFGNSFKLVEGEDRPQRRQKMEEFNIKDAAFESRVSAHLITSFSEATMRITALILFTVLAALYVWLRRMT